MALHDLELELAMAWPPAAWQDVTVLVAVSGGGDSVALLRAMAALKAAGSGPAPAAAGRLVAAHVNHQLRGAESEADEAFVVDLCRRLGIVCEVGRPGEGGEEDAETRRRGDAGTEGRGDAETRRRGDTGTEGRGDAETRGRGDAGTEGRGDAETRRRGDAEGGAFPPVPPFARPRVPASPRPRVPSPNPQSPIPNPQSLIPNPQSPNPCSPEAAARHARYAFLEQAAGRLGARYVVTAHTADDQAETILHRILRGTGIRGLAGMRRSRPLGPATLLRPLLGVRRAKLAAYLEQLGQPSRRDSSNRSLRFTRNRIRHRLLPHLAERFNPGVVDALLRLGTLAAESQTIIDRLVDDLAERSLRPGGPQTLRIARQKLEDQPKYLLGELLAGLWRRQGWPMQAMGHEKWELLAAMLGSGGQDPHTPRKVLFPGAVTVEIAGDELRATRTPPPG